MTENIRSRTDHKKTEKKNKKIIFLGKILAVAYTISMMAFLVMLAWLNVLPMKYMLILVVTLAVLSLFVIPVLYSRRGKPSRKKKISVVAGFAILLFFTGIYYMGATLNFFGDITEVAKDKEDFYLLVPVQSSCQEGKDLSGETVGAQADNDKNYNQARKELTKKFDIEYDYFTEGSELLQDLIEGEHRGIFISAAFFESMKGQDASLESKVRIIHTISIAREENRKAKEVNITKESFNVLITGLDVEGDIDIVSRSDVNMVATVNPATKEVLLTSIPRDYYVTLPSKKAKDKLTHSGLYGASETVKAVEELLGLEINYYVKVNYSTVVKLVDAIGGIEIQSPYQFTTHGMSDIYTFEEGYNHLDGSQALAYSRERASWEDGDMRRNENQQIVFEAILKKVTRSTTILSEYTSILGAVKDHVETDMTKGDMTDLIKMQLKDMPSWKIEKQAIKGVPDLKKCYALGFEASVVNTDETLVAEAVDKIMEVKEP